MFYWMTEEMYEAIYGPQKTLESVVEGQSCDVVDAIACTDVCEPNGVEGQICEVDE